MCDDPPQAMSIDSTVPASVQGAPSNPAGANRLGSVPAQRWAEVHAEMPAILASIGPTVPNQLAHLPATAPPELVVAHLHRDGGVIIDKAVSEEVCDAVVREMQPYIDETNSGKDSFVGKVTKRTGALAARSPASWEILAHPVLMNACAGVLGQQLLHDIPETERKRGFAPDQPTEHSWQLMLTQIIQIGPGEPAQPLHRDRYAFTHDAAFALAHLEPELSTIWALNEFTADIGPTRVVPGSHRWPRDRPKPKDEEAAHAVMAKGSVVIYTGSVYHSGGNNRTAATPRIGLNVDYNLGWLRQEENQYLSCPPSVAKDLPRDIQDLIGYRMSGSALGYFDGGLSPKGSFKDRPINWASDWQARLGQSKL